MLYFTLAHITLGFPPDINEGDPNAVCPVTPIFNIATCNVGTNYCLPPGSRNTVQLLCQHRPPPTPETPTPQIGVWFLNGTQISSNNDGSRLPETPSSITLTSTGQRLSIAPGMVPLGNYTCMLTNIAGFDVATTIITDCGELSSFNFFTTGSHTHSSTSCASTSKNRRSLYNSDWGQSTLSDYTSDYHLM